MGGEGAGHRRFGSAKDYKECALKRLVKYANAKLGFLMHFGVEIGGKRGAVDL